MCLYLPHFDLLLPFVSHQVGAQIEEKSERVTNRLIDFTVGAQHLQDPLKRPQENSSPSLAPPLLPPLLLLLFIHFEQRPRKKTCPNNVRRAASAATLNPREILAASE